MEQVAGGAEGAVTGSDVVRGEQPGFGQRDQRSMGGVLRTAEVGGEVTDANLDHPAARAGMGAGDETLERDPR